MRVLLLRHGATPGNLEKRYIGTTDEPLSEEGRKQLATVHFPAPELLVCSPLRRCIETAELVFPGMPCIIEPDFRECDFGDFEEKNYTDLSSDPRYQAWIDSGGTLPFPGGESPAAFRNRCAAAFSSLLREHSAIHDMALVVHGGTIMSILSDRLGGDYYSYQIPNGGHFLYDTMQNTLLQK